MYGNAVNSRYKLDYQADYTRAGSLRSTHMPYTRDKYPLRVHTMSSRKSNSNGLPRPRRSVSIGARLVTSYLLTKCSAVPEASASPCSLAALRLRRMGGYVSGMRKYQATRVAL
jgi:hypothetical protein